MTMTWTNWHEVFQQKATHRVYETGTKIWEKCNSNKQYTANYIQEGALSKTDFEYVCKSRILVISFQVSYVTLGALWGPELEMMLF
jgi:hypothetical protein